MSFMYMGLGGCGAGAMRFLAGLLCGYPHAQPQLVGDQMSRWVLEPLAQFFRCSYGPSSGSLVDLSWALHGVGIKATDEILISRLNSWPLESGRLGWNPSSFVYLGQVTQKEGSFPEPSLWHLLNGSVFFTLLSARMNDRIPVKGFWQCLVTHSALPLLLLLPLPCFSSSGGKMRPREGQDLAPGTCWVFGTARLDTLALMTLTFAPGFLLPRVLSRPSQPWLQSTQISITIMQDGRSLCIGIKMPAVHRCQGPGDHTGRAHIL